MSKPTTTYTIKIDGMHCVSCALGIDLQLEDLPGVISAETNYARSQTILTVESPNFDLTKAHATIKDLGYRISGE